MSQIVFFGALIALICVAFAVSALWQRSRAGALALVFVLLTGAAGLYLFEGKQGNPATNQAASTKTLEEAVAQLERRVADDPKDVRSLVLLARSYMKLEKFDRARDTYASAAKLMPEDGDLAVEYVGALMRASADQSFPPFAVDLLEKTLAKNPHNQQALFFLGMHQMQTKQYAKAAATWESLTLPLEPNAAIELRLQVEVARMRAGLPPLPAAVLNIELGIDAGLAQQLKKGDVIFAYARGLSAGGPIVAVKRIVVDHLPVTLYLTDSDSPLPDSGLSAQSRVVLQARLSRTGDVMQKSGDLETAPVEVATTFTGPNRLVLDRTVR